MQNSAVELLIAERPVFHPAQWGSSQAVIRWLAENTRPGHRTLETGSGHSTVTLLAAGAEHTAIAPSSDQREKILAWCAAHDVSTDNLTFVDARSQDVLPAMELAELDLVLIDGWHAFPIPMIDWYWTAPALKIGGHMVIDDTQIRPIRYLSEYLSADRERWRKVVQIETTAVFQKLRSDVVDAGEWHAHPHSRRPIYTPLVRARRAGGRLKRRLRPRG
jgi:precorrin-6B methylase 2